MREVVIVEAVRAHNDMPITIFGNRLNGVGDHVQQRIIDRIGLQLDLVDRRVEPQRDLDVAVAWEAFGANHRGVAVRHGDVCCWRDQQDPDGACLK